MNVTVDASGLHIRIPTDILARTELTLEEKYVLAQIRDLPGCGNHALSTVLGITVSGVEAMMARLRREGHIEMLGEGKARTHRVLPRTGDALR
jgi:DNA-binding MarR family transcriptional regulator